MAAPPAQKLATIWAVTSCGQGVTPSATTPWSPANTATAAGVGERRRARAGDAGELRAERLQASQRAGRLRQATVERHGLGHGRGVRGPDAGQCVDEGTGTRAPWLASSGRPRPYALVEGEALHVHGPGTLARRRARE